MSEATNGTSAAMLAAMNELWRLRRPGPDSLLAHPAFARLLVACREGYPNIGNPAFALLTALKALGLPCELRDENAHLALPVKEAVNGLDAALRATYARRVHLAPLDLADYLPPLEFGSAKMCRLKPDELRALVDERRLSRVYPRQVFDADRFSQFQWLIVEETVTLDREPEARAAPALCMDFSQDLGRIVPHRSQLPSVFEEALFFLFLAPWESWSTIPAVDWRGFRVPWVYSVDSDIFVRPSPPPSPDTLSWEEYTYDDGYGGTYEGERPLTLPLDNSAAAALTAWDQSGWLIVSQAKRSALFETPIAHFFIRAFLAEGVDEFLAHIITIEAALGLRADHCQRYRAAPDRHKGMSATKRMCGRIAGLLGDRRFADQYEQLFNIRSAYLHGRVMTEISTAERIMARSLARRIVEELIAASQKGPIASREDYLDSLLDIGAPLI